MNKQAHPFRARNCQIGHTAVHLRGVPHNQSRAHRQGGVQGFEPRPDARVAWRGARHGAALQLLLPPSRQ